MEEPSLSDVFVIKPAYSGLGDHLFYSHLPRIAKQSGRFRTVLVSNRANFRHAEYRHLIWESNPYVDGFTDEDAPTLTLGAVPPGANILDAVMRFRELDDDKRFHEPELYFNPPPEPLVQSATVYDPNFVSFVGKISTPSVDRFFERQGEAPDFMLQLRGNAVPTTRFGKILEACSLEHYCAIIRSARRFVCLTSGGATLAAALGTPATALWGSGQNTMFHHSRLHRYVNVNPNFGDRSYPRAYGAYRRGLLRVRASLRNRLSFPEAR